MNLDLTGKLALVCGSTQGIGKASAMELARLGATIVLAARNEEALQQVKKELPNQENAHDYIVADFTQPDQLKEVVEAFIKTNAIHFSILINNTGGPPGGPITDAQTDEFEKTFTQHLICNHVLTQTLLEGMKESGYGRIINIISTSVKQPLNGLGVSNTIRGAVANWSKTMANELGRFGITVNNVLPGTTSTGRLKSIIENKAQKSGFSVSEIENQMLKAVPLGRFAKTEEVANAVAFLASPAAAYINGINIPVDGGRTSSL